MDSVNSTFIWNKQLAAIDDSLTRKLDSAQVAFTLFHQSDSSQRVQLSLRQSFITERDTLIAQQQRVIHHREQQIIKLKVHKGLLAAMDAVLIGLIAYILIF